MTASMRQQRLRIGPSLAAWCAVGLLLSCAQAEPSSPEIRRILAPADRPERWPTGNQRFLPIETERLQQLQQATPSASPRAAWIHLQAAYQEDGTIAGSGRLRVEVSQPSFLSWPRSTTEITNARWQKAGRAQLGSWPAADAAKADAEAAADPDSDADDNPDSDPAADTEPHGLVAPQSGVLLFDFRTRAIRWRSSRGDLELKLPAALQRTVELQTPSWMRLSAATDSLAPIVTRLPAEEQNQWRIAAPPRGKVRLIVEDNRPLQRTVKPRLACAEQTTVNIQLDGAQFKSTFTLWAESRLPEQLRIALPAGCVIESAHIDGKPTPVLTANGVRSIEFPANYHPLETTLTLSGWSTVALNETWPIPRLQLPDADWSEGILDVALGGPIELVDMPLKKGVAAIDNAPPPPAAKRPPWRLRFQLISPDAQLAVHLRQAAEPLVVKIDRECTLATDALRSTITSTFTSSAEVPQTEIQYALQKGWQVESVESRPTNLLERWQTDRRSGGSRLRLTFGPSVAEQSLDGAEIIVRAQRSVSQRHLGVWSLSELLALQPANVDVWQDQLSLRTSSSRRLSLAGFDVNRRLPVDGDRSLVERLEEEKPTSSPTEIESRIELTGMNPRQLVASRVTVEQQRPELSVDTIVRLSRPADSGGGVSYHLSSEFNQPRSASEWIEVVFDAALPPQTEWRTLASGQPLVAQPIKTEPARAARTRWRIRPGRGGLWSGFSMTTRWPEFESGELPLVGVARASSQRGQVRLGRELFANVWLDSKGLRPQTSSLAATTGDTIYAYEPIRALQRANVGQSAILKLIATRYDAQDQLESYTTAVGIDGVVRHTAVYSSLYSAQEFVYRLPAGAKLVGIDSVAASAADLTDAEPTLISPPQPQRHKITLRYVTTGERLQHGTTLAPRLPVEPASPDAFAWRVELPPGFTMTGYDLAGRHHQRTITERLLGPFASHTVASLWGSFGATETPVANVWTRYDLIGEPQAERRIGDSKRWFAAQLAILLAVTIVGAMMAARWPRLLMLATCGAFSLALVVPGEAAPLAACGWLGGVLAVALRVVAYRLAEQFASRSGTTRSSIESPTTTVLRPLSVLLLATLLATSSDAQERVKLESVIVPVDQSLTPVGDKVYVREAFLADLIAAERRRQRVQPSDTLLRATHVRGRLARTVEGTLAVRRWSAEIELTTFARGAKVWLPLRQSDADWEATVMVDGAPRPLHWSPLGDQCWFTVDQPGDARAVLPFRPVVEVSAGESCVQLAIAPLNASRLTLWYPADHRDMRVPFADVSLRHDEQEDQLTASLASRDELLVCWTDDPIQQQQERASVQLLEWLRITPREVFLDVQLRSEEPGVSLSSIQIDTPTGGERIEPPPCPPDELANVDPETLAIRRLAFRLPRNSPLGVVRPAKLNITGGEVRSRYLAISVADCFDWSLSAIDLSSALSTEEFLAHWAQPGEMGPDIDRALTLQTSTRPELTIQAAESEELLAQGLELRVSAAETTIRFTADYRHNGGSPKHQAYAVPERFIIDRVIESAEGQQEVACRWTRPVAGRLVVFGGQESDNSRVVITGRTPHVKGVTVAPLVVDWSATTPLRVALARDAEVRIDSLEPNWETSPTAEVATDGSLTVATATYRRGEEPLVFIVQPNLAKFVTQSVTHYQRGRSKLTASWHVHGKVVQGLASRLPLQFAAGVKPRVTLLDNEYRLVRGKRLGGPDWWLTFPTPHEPGEVIEAQLPLLIDEKSVDRPPVDPVLIVGHPHRSSRLATSESAEQPPGRWRVSNLAPAELPAWLANIKTAADRWRTYRRDSKRSAPAIAWEASTGTGLNASVVKLADHLVLLAATGDCTIESRLVIEPHGSRSCWIRLPQGHRLMSAWVDGLPAACRPVTSTTEADPAWQVPLRDGVRQGELLLLTSGPLGSRVAPATVVTPRGDSVPLTSWYEIYSTSHHVIASAEGLTPLSAKQLHAARQHAIEALETGAPTSNVEALKPREARPVGGRRTAFSAVGPHAPPRVEQPSVRPLATRWATAILVFAAALASAKFVPWPKLTRPESTRPESAQ